MGSDETGRNITQQVRAPRASALCLTTLMKRMMVGSTCVESGGEKTSSKDVFGSNLKG